LSPAAALLVTSAMKVIRDALPVLRHERIA
jgi:hypothetical protein